jgi:preprotein translocase subunit YajC
MKRMVYLSFLWSSALAALAQDNGGGTGSTPSMGDQLSSMLFMMAIIFGIFYFLLIRPQQKQRQKHEERINALKKGDRVIGAGGIYGEIVGIEEDKAVIAVGRDKVKLEILKSSITHILGEESQKK